MNNFFSQFFYHLNYLKNINYFSCFLSLLNFSSFQLFINLFLYFLELITIRCWLSLHRANTRINLYGKVDVERDDKPPSLVWPLIFFFICNKNWEKTFNYVQWKDLFIILTIVWKLFLLISRKIYQLVYNKFYWLIEKFIYYTNDCLILFFLAKIIFIDW